MTTRSLRAVAKRLPRVLAILLTATFLVLGLSRLDLNDDSFLTSLEKRWIDAKFRFRGEQMPERQVVIVAVGEKTLNTLGSVRTFSRDNWAKLVDRMAAGSPKVIGFDMLFIEADAAGPENDQRFADAIRRAGNVVLGVYLPLKAETAARDRSAPMDPALRRIAVEKRVFPTEFRPAGGSRALIASIQGSDLRLNLPVLTDAGASFGFVNFHPDKEGRLRHQPQFIEYGGNLYPSLDVQLLRRYLDAPSPEVTISDGRIEQVAVGDIQIPTDEFGRYMVNFAGRGCRPPAPCLFETIEMVDLMDGTVSPDVLKGRIALVGTPAVGQGDVRPTPFDEWLPGVELHANVLDNLLTGRHLYRDGFTKTLDLFLILCFGILPAIFLPRFGALRSVLLSALVMASFVAMNVWAFVGANRVLSLVYPGFELVLVSGGLIAFNYLTEEREKKRTRQTFQFYLDRQVIEQVMNRPELLRLGGEKCEMSVLFSDIRGFSSFSEKMAPAEVVQFLNVYFDRMTGLIFEYQGTLDKLIGDAVMSFWGHPIEIDDHAVRSTVCALEMIHAVEDLRPVLILPGGARFEIGIGINTGPMVVGNMGSQSRFSYTVMGDNVNLGSRLESLNKHYGTRILISDTTYAACRHIVHCRELDTIQVKGKSQAVTIYEPMGLRREPAGPRSLDDRREALSQVRRMWRAHAAVRDLERGPIQHRLGAEKLKVTLAQEEVCAVYEHALGLYRSKDFEAAERAFDHVLSLSPGDGPSRLMKDRIAKYRNDQGEDESQFDGVYRFYEK